MFNIEIIHTIDLIDVQQSRTGGADTVRITQSGLPARVSLTQSINETENQRKPVRMAKINLFEDIELKVGQLIQFEKNIYEVQSTNRTVDFDGSFLFWFIQATKSIKKIQ